jgi:hypothetical protein
MGKGYIRTVAPSSSMVLSLRHPAGENGGSFNVSNWPKFRPHYAKEIDELNYAAE